jgi:hypothetical protein
MVSYADRVKETTTVTGTGAASMGGATTGFQAFSAAFSTGNTVHYTIAGQGTAEWEVGLGTLTSGTPWTLTRTTVLASSNAGAAVVFSAGTKDVFVTMPASILNLIQTAVQAGRQVLPGTGMSGGGDLSADRTLTAKPSTALFGPFTTLASATTTDLSTIATVGISITGTTTITGFGTGASLLRIVTFAGALTLTHNATSLILPGGANITTAAGDCATFLSDGSGNWRCTDYTRADGSIVGTIAFSKIASAAIATAAEYRTGTATKVLENDLVWSAATTVALTDGATVTPDLSAGINFTLTLGGNRTLANPTNQKVGQSGFIRIAQDATGSRTLAYGGNWKFASGTAPVLTTTASKVDVLFYTVTGSSEIVANLVKAVV